MKSKHKANAVIGVLTCLLLLVTFTSCSSSGDRTSELAFEYYSFMEARLDILVNKLDQFNEALKSMDTNRIRTQLDTLKTLVTRIADDVSQLGPFEGNTVLRDAFLDNIEFFETLIHEDYETMADYVINRGSFPMEEITEFNRAFLEKLNTIAPALEKEVQKAHEPFLIKHRVKDWAERKGLLNENESDLSGSSRAILKQYEYLENHGLSSERKRYRKQRQVLQGYRDM